MKVKYLPGRFQVQVYCLQQKFQAEGLSTTLRKALDQASTLKAKLMVEYKVSVAEKNDALAVGRAASAENAELHKRVEALTNQLALVTKDADSFKKIKTEYDNSRRQLATSKRQLEEETATRTEMENDYNLTIMH